MKTILPRIALALSLALGAAGGATAADAPVTIAGATTVDADKLIKLIETTPSLVILDNRKEGDYAAGHIEGAVRLIDTDITGPEVLAKHVAAKDTPVAFYCNGLKCGRAAAAAQKAVGYGYGKVYYYALGMDEWKAKGLPLVTK
ncbi:MAG: rhodanese-like domain-containing protein [Pseudomonadota bacterium]